MYVHVCACLSLGHALEPGQEVNISKNSYMGIGVATRSRTRAFSLTDNQRERVGTCREFALLSIL
jgi:hypothetical protein